MSSSKNSHVDLKKSIILSCINRIVKYKRQSVPVIITIILLVPILMFKDQIIALGSKLPECEFLRHTGYYCPGCGITRAIKSLLRGDLILSLRYNVMPIFLGVNGLLIYVEWVLKNSSKKISLVPKGDWFPIVFASVAVVYFIARNYIPWIMPNLINS